MKFYLCMKKYFSEYQHEACKVSFITKFRVRMTSLKAGCIFLFHHVRPLEDMATGHGISHSTECHFMFDPQRIWNCWDFMAVWHLYLTCRPRHWVIRADGHGDHRQSLCYCSITEDCERKPQRVPVWFAVRVVYFAFVEEINS